jgi:TatA/E family protein of Tat protein translocase
VLGIGGTELFIIGVFAFLLFGPDKVPELARTAGKFWKQFNQTREDMERMIRAEVYAKDPENDAFGPTSPASAAEAVDRLPGVAGPLSLEDDEEEEEE